MTNLASLRAAWRPRADGAIDVSGGLRWAGHSRFGIADEAFALIEIHQNALPRTVTPWRDGGVEPSLGSGAWAIARFSGGRRTVSHRAGGVLRLWRNGVSTTRTQASAACHSVKTPSIAWTASCSSDAVVENSATASHSLSPHVRASLRCIRRRPAEPLTLREVARDLGRQAEYLGWLFRHETGTTFHERLTTIRMRHAARRIRDGEKIDAVVLLVGYRKQKEFLRSVPATLRRDTG